MELPLLVPVPPSPVRSSIPQDEWEAILDAWMVLIELRLQISRQEDLEKCAAADAFNVSFFTSYLGAAGDARLHAGPKGKKLRKLVFLLFKKYVLEVPQPSKELLDWRLLGDLAVCYHANSAMKELLASLWSRYSETISSTLETGKITVSKRLSAPCAARQELLDEMRKLTVLASALPPAGHVLMTGSDYLDSLWDAYRSLAQAGGNQELKSALVANAYVALTSLLKGAKPNLSLLLDHLFTLKEAAAIGSRSAQREGNLLSDLVCSTDLLIRMERYMITTPQKRGKDLVATLRTYQQEMKSLHHRYQRHKRKDKGKGRAVEADAVDGELHAHKLSLVTQVQDLFPDLGGGYVIRLLDFYNQNVEEVISHLLDDTLPSELKALDKSEALPNPNIIQQYDHVAPRPTTLPSPRRTKSTFTVAANLDDDDDEIIQAAKNEGIGGGKVHFGRAHADLTADTLLADRSSEQRATNKAAILSALAAFDSDDDERDDTYDVADVGGTVDSVAATRSAVAADGDILPRGRQVPSADVSDEEDLDLKLYRLYKADPKQFARDAATRRSSARASLKREFGMTDEAIEGWAVMLERDSKKAARLERKLALDAGVTGGRGGQPPLESTAYRKPAKGEENGDEEEEDEDEAEEEDSAASGQRGGGGRGRGGRRAGGGGPGRGSARGRGGGGGGGRGRGGGGRGRGANHRRRDQHAKKMARAGALPS